jgi:dTDP-4-amino-4,6-dideoxygalactose transaminase
MDLFEPVREFERQMADFCGASYAVAAESGSAAIFLSLLYYKEALERRAVEITIPARTYPSVPAAIIHTGNRVKFKDFEWQAEGFYALTPFNIIDSARFISRGMFNTLEKIYQSAGSGDFLVCLSFHIRKSLAIGRGGMVLTDSEAAKNWLKCARHDGRNDGVPLKEDTLAMAGWNFLLTPEQAVRGLSLMEHLKDENRLPYEEYPDLSKYKFFREANQ